MEIESALVAHHAIAEAAVIAVSDEFTGQQVVAYIVLNQNADPGPSLGPELREHVTGRIGKIARPQRIIPVDDLPKTRSGKIMRRLLRDTAENRAPGDATTLADPSVMDRVRQATGRSSR